MPTDRDSDLLHVSICINTIFLIAILIQLFFDIEFPAIIVEVMVLVQVPVHLVILFFYIYYRIRKEACRNTLLESWLFLNIVWWTLASNTSLFKSF